MSEAYRIKRFHHVTPRKHRRLLNDNLIPLIDNFAEARLISDDIDDIMSSAEALKLGLADFDKSESNILTVQNLISGDWLIEYTYEDQPVYLYKIKGYRYEPHVHLYIKHFAELEHLFKVKASSIPEEALRYIITADHLTTLPLSVSSMLEKYEALAHARNEKLRKQQLEGEQAAKDEVKRKRFSYGTVPVARRRVSKNGPVIIKKTAKDSRIKDLDVPTFTRSQFTGHSIAKLRKNKSK